jgi:hypothetical protein
VEHNSLEGGASYLQLFRQSLIARLGGKNLANLSNQFAASADRQFEFQKRRQLFIRSHNETLPIAARCASAIQIVRPLESIADTQPQLQPALLRLSAMISQYFILTDAPTHGPSRARDLFGRKRMP